jgi:hypothetical protein
MTMRKNNEENCLDSRFPRKGRDRRGNDKGDRIASGVPENEQTNPIPPNPITDNELCEKQPHIDCQAASRLDLLDYGKSVVGSAGDPNLPGGLD